MSPEALLRNRTSEIPSPLKSPTPTTLYAVEEPAISCQPCNAPLLIWYRYVATHSVDAAYSPTAVVLFGTRDEKWVPADPAGVWFQLRTDTGESVYRRCSDDHHHHLVCRACGSTVEIQGGDVEAWAAEVARDHGFSDVSHTIEIFGICGACADR